MTASDCAAASLGENQGEAGWKHPWAVGHEQDWTGLDLWCRKYQTNSSTLHSKHQSDLCDKHGWGGAGSNPSFYQCHWCNPHLKVMHPKKHEKIKFFALVDINEQLKKSRKSLLVSLQLQLNSTTVKKHLCFVLFRPQVKEVMMSKV